MSLVTTQAAMPALTAGDFTSDNTAGGAPEIIAQVIDGLLDQGYGFYHGRWEPGVVRFVTSFATTARDVDELVHAVRRLTPAAIEESRSKRAGTQISASGRRSEVAYKGRVR